MNRLTAGLAADLTGLPLARKPAIVSPRALPFVVTVAVDPEP
jgi:hypothetical protein